MADPETEARLEKIETRLAEALRALEDLSQVAARQDTDLARALRRIDMLLQREAERESDATGTVPIDTPPHY